MIKFLNFIKLLIIVVAILVGGFFVWSKYEKKNDVIVKNIIPTFITQAECEQATQKQCSYGMCDYNCGKNYWEGWRATNKELVKTANVGAEEKEVRRDSSGAEKNKPEVVPNKILIDVPFTSQAPFGKWDVYHEEACEEASIIMVKYFLDKQKLTPEIAEREIQKMIKFQIEKYGNYQDSDAKDVAKLAKDFYGLNLRVVYDFKKEDLKKELAKGQPIIVPAAGRLLGNPNFTAPGPLYHALVLVGYEGDTIITNDPGTRKGEGYRYNVNVLYGAIHDFTGKKEEIEQGRKAMIIITRE